MVDVDHFKMLNDTFGHQHGDECLRIIARELDRLQQVPEAFVARYGGEEMAILLPDTEAALAENLANHFCRSIFSLRLPHAVKQNDGVVTVSCGVATIKMRGTKDERLPKELLMGADKALYKAKLQGRNRVESLVMRRDEKVIA